MGVVVNGETYYADTFVIAAGCWTGTLTAQLDVPIHVEPAKGQIVLVEAMPPLFRANHRLDSVSTLFREPTAKILLGATVEFVGYDKTATVEGAKQLIDAGIAIAPELAQCRFVQTWVGLRPYTKKGPLLGYLPGYDNVRFSIGTFQKWYSPRADHRTPYR